MAEVTGLRVDPRRPRRVEVFLDGRRWRSVSPDTAASLAVGMTLDDEALAALEDRTAEAEAMARIGRLLARRPCSEAEARRRLVRAGTEPGVIERVVARLRQAGDLDDAAFARAWVENRATFRPRSPAMLRAELRGRGVDSATIESALAGVDEAQAASSAARSAARRWANLEPAARRDKLYAFLARRGFDHATIRRALRSLEPAPDTESEELP